MKSRLLLLFILSASLTQAEPEPTWYKGNTHTHSLWSDGNDFPEMIVDWYRARGYNFLVLSDHNTLSRGDRWMDISRIRKKQALDKYRARFGDRAAFRDDVDGKRQVRLTTYPEMQEMFDLPGRFLLVEGEEITARGIDPEYPLKVKHVHINAMNLETLVKPIKGKPIREVMRSTLQALRKQEAETGHPILDHINHPNFYYSISVDDLAQVVEEQFFEVYNGHPGVRQLGDTNHPPMNEMWDLANAIRIFTLDAAPLYGIASDDSHYYHGGNISPGRGWVMVKADALDSDKLVMAMRRGDFYASTGVYLRKIEYDPKTRRLQILIAPDADQTFTTRIIGLDRETMAGKERARFDTLVIDYTLGPDDRCIRAEITSSRLHPNPSFKEQVEEAWTQPVGWERSEAGAE